MSVSKVTVMLLIILWTMGIDLEPQRMEASVKKVSLDFTQIKVRDALERLARLSNINLIIDGQIKQSISLHLRGVPCSQALEDILKSQNLVKYTLGNVWIITSREKSMASQRLSQSAQDQGRDLAPLQTEQILIRYAKADQVASQCRKLLSTRGYLIVDTRTNSLWVKDVPYRLNGIQRIINTFDVPIPQILIEARLVSVNRSFERELGLRFGISYPSHLSGTLEAANALASGKHLNKIPLKERLNMDLPVPNLTRPFSIGLALAQLSKNIFLDLELSAMESQGSGRIISSPQLITENRQPALIEAGSEIPYQVKTTRTSHVNFKKAALSLSVVPHIIPRRRVELELKITQNQPSFSQVQGMPIIDTREIQTTISVVDGETVVLGGIVEDVQNQQVRRIPFLGSLPIIGSFFKNQVRTDDNKELLIFVTPHILNSRYLTALNGFHKVG